MGLAFRVTVVIKQGVWDETAVRGYCRPID